MDIEHCYGGCVTTTKTTEYIKATKEPCTARSSEYHLAGRIQFYFNSNRMKSIHIGFIVWNTMEKSWKNQSLVIRLLFFSCKELLCFCGSTKLNYKERNQQKIAQLFSNQCYKNNQEDAMVTSKSLRHKRTQERVELESGLVVSRVTYLETHHPTLSQD